MRPPGGARRLVAELPAARMGDKLTLAAGIIGEYGSHRDPGLTPTRVVVEEGATGRRLLEISIPPGLEGMQQVERRGTPELPAELDLKVWIESQNPALRDTCVELFSDSAR
jgi:hypothetical protein